MPKYSSIFAFFEVVAEELSSEPSRVIARSDSRFGEEGTPLFEELKAETQLYLPRTQFVPRLDGSTGIFVERVHLFRFRMILTVDDSLPSMFLTFSS